MAHLLWGFESKPHRVEFYLSQNPKHHVPYPPPPPSPSSVIMMMVVIIMMKRYKIGSGCFGHCWLASAAPLFLPHSTPTNAPTMHYICTKNVTHLRQKCTRFAPCMWHIFTNNALYLYQNCDVCTNKAIYLHQNDDIFSTKMRQYY